MRWCCRFSSGAARPFAARAKRFRADGGIGCGSWLSERQAERAGNWSSRRSLKAIRSLHLSATRARLPIEHPNLRIVKGNVLDYASVESAMGGQSAVLCALGHKRFLYPNKIQSNGMRNILRAMKTCNVPRLICESALGIGNSVGRLGLPHTFLILPLILPFYMWDKLRQEELISASDRDWVIVRPGVLKNGEARGSYRHGPKVGNYFWPVVVTRADVADFMLKQLTDDTYVGGAPGVGY